MSASWAYVAATMDRIRAFIEQHRRVAIALVALALCMKALLPTGYMISDSARTFTVTICNGTTGEMVAKEIVIPSKGSSSHQSDTHGKADAQCSWSSLSMAGLGGADAPLLALAIAFILALGILPAPSLPFRRAHYLHPPLRGPPAAA